MKEIASFIALCFVRALFSILAGVIMVLGIILYSPFPDFWRELKTDAKK